MNNTTDQGKLYYTVGTTVLIVAVLQSLSVVWMPLFAAMAIVGSGFAAEGAVRDGRAKTAMYLILAGWLTPAILMAGGIIWNQQNISATLLH